MIWLLGDEDEARAVAAAAGLKPHEWRRLHWHRQLHGERDVHVIGLESALHWPRETFGAIVDQLAKQRAIRWSETDLYTGKVPR